jgi:hypothetical protein
MKFLPLIKLHKHKNIFIYFYFFIDLIMNIDIMFHGHHLQRIQKYPFVYGDCLFDFLTFLFHYAQTSFQF